MTNFEKIKAMSIEEMADIQGYEGLYKIDRWKCKRCKSMEKK